MSGEATNRAWGYLSYSHGTLYGSVSNEEHRVSPRYELSTLYTESVSLFAMDGKTGTVKWRYQPEHSIRNNAITIGGKSRFLVDRPLVMADRVTDPRRGGRHLPLLKPEEIPSATLVSLDAATGEIRWKQADAGLPDWGLEYGNPDFVQYANSYGATGHRVEATEDFVPLLESCFQDGGVHLVEAPIDYSENKRVLIDELAERVCLI